MTTSHLRVSAHAAERYLERKVGYSKEEMSDKLISDAKKELYEYVPETTLAETKDGDITVLRHEIYNIDFVVRAHIVVTCYATSRTPRSLPIQRDNTKGDWFYKSKRLKYA